MHRDFSYVGRLGEWFKITLTLPAPPQLKKMPVMLWIVGPLLVDDQLTVTDEPMVIYRL